MDEDGMLSGSRVYGGAETQTAEGGGRHIGSVLRFLFGLLILRLLSNDLFPTRLSISHTYTIAS